jgi:uncharacterized RDD family membrane protein YckC
MNPTMLRIRTPEGIVFSQLLAGPVTRFLAWFIDLLCILVLLTTLGRGLILLQTVSSNLAGSVCTLGYFVISIGYGMACEWRWRGQTVGKKLFRLRVMDAQGLGLQFNQIVTRNLLRFVDALPASYFIGGVTCWLNPKCQRFGGHRREHHCHPQPARRAARPRPVVAGQVQFAPPIAAPGRAPPPARFPRRGRPGHAGGTAPR